MSRTPIEEILQLPADDRVQIAQQIWESVAEHPEEVTLTAAQREELERRWKAMQESPDAGEDWEAFRAKLQSE
ncbi:MAG TPA: addiction module protein [Thermoanaerobaculia bacterium]|jgi:putative addiction module component (TIGR02574 family)|nr:addiction module protein [Thermoanaerobaculia bacterium]